MRFRQWLCESTPNWCFLTWSLKSSCLGIYTHFEVVRSYNINCPLGVLYSILDWSLICDYWDFIIEGNKKSDHAEWYGFDVRNFWTPRNWSQPPNFDFDYKCEHAIPLRSLAHSKSSLKICRTFFAIKCIESPYNLKAQVQSKSIECECNLGTIRSNICKYSSFHGRSESIKCSHYPIKIGARNILLNLIFWPQTFGLKNIVLGAAFLGSQ